MPALSKTQKADIGRLARQAWLAWPGRAEFCAANPTLSESACFTAWRHVEQGSAVGRQSLRECTSEGDFLRLCAHFLSLARRPVAAQRTLRLAASEGQRLAAYKLRQELAARGLASGYAAAICQRQFRCALAEASEKQLWCLVFTIRNRRPALSTQ